MSRLKNLSTEIALILLMILVALAAFGLGRLSVTTQESGVLKVVDPGEHQL